MEIHGRIAPFQANMLRWLCVLRPGRQISRACPVGDVSLRDVIMDNDRLSKNGDEMDLVR